MAYYQLLIHTWCDGDPSESDLEDDLERNRPASVVLGKDAICTLRETVAPVESAAGYWGYGTDEVLWRRRRGCRPWAGQTDTATFVSDPRGLQ
jgi:hypothetical protein